MENKFGGNGDTEDQIYINHHPIDSATSSDYTLFYVIILIVAILLIVVAATIMICFCSKDKKFKFNHLKAKALHAEYETKLQNMIKPGQTINTKELANVIHNLTESNEENKEIMERLSMVDRKKRMQYTEETAEIFSSVNSLFLCNICFKFTLHMILNIKPQTT